jgi:hypothetical protein
VSKCTVYFRVYTLKNCFERTSGTIKAIAAWRKTINLESWWAGQQGKPRDLPAKIVDGCKSEEQIRKKEVTMKTPDLTRLSHFAESFEVTGSKNRGKNQLQGERDVHEERAPPPRESRSCLDLTREASHPKAVTGDTLTLGGLSAALFFFWVCRGWRYA